MGKNQTRDETNILAGVEFGARLQELIGNPGDGQIELIMRNGESIIALLNKLEIFGGGLEPYCAITASENAQPEALVARYSKRSEQIFVFLTTDAEPAVVSRVLSSLPGELIKVKKEFVFFGYQNPELNKTEMNGKAEIKSYSEAGITLPNNYMQVFSLLGSAARSYASDALAKAEILKFLTNKRPRGSSLLVGNGINLLNNSDLGWTSILQQLVTDSISEAEQPTANGFITDKAIPSPIKFEYLADHSKIRLGKTNAFQTLKDHIASITSGGSPGINLPPTSIQDLLKKADIDSLMTTNYDLALEQCFGMDSRSITERKFILHPTTPNDVAPSIYHVHGIVNRASTICIGYEHYMAYVQKLRSRLIRHGRSKETAEQIVFLMLRLVPFSRTWEELFFTTNMSIVGLGLAFEETDLWELLVLRAAVLNTSNALRSIGLPEEVFTNTITYYAVEVPDSPSRDDEKSPDYVTQANRIRELASPVIDGEYWLPVPDEKAKEQALKGLNVKVQVVHTTDYKKGYEMILGSLPTRI